MLAWADRRPLGRLTGVASPVRSANQRLHVRSCASASLPRIVVPPNQSAFVANDPVRRIGSHRRSGGPARPGRIPRRAPTNFVAWACAAFSDPAASLEVLSPSAHSGRAALSEAAGLERSRFGVARRSPALADSEIGVLALAVLRSAEIRRRCSHDGCASASFARAIHLSAPRQAR